MSPSRVAKCAGFCVALAVGTVFSFMLFSISNGRSEIAIPEPAAAIDSTEQGELLKLNADRGRHRREAPAEGPKPEPNTEVEGGVGACLMASTKEELWDCLAARFQSIGPSRTIEEVALMTCGALRGAEVPEMAVFHTTVFGLLLHPSSGEPLHVLDTIRSICPYFQMDAFIAKVVLSSREMEPGLYERIRASLTANAIFDANAGGMAVRLAGALARELEDEQLQAILLEGVAGRLGGSGEQIDLAITEVGLMVAEPAQLVAMAIEVRESSYLPHDCAEAGVGATLAALLTCPAVSESPGGMTAIVELSRTLDDPELGLGAAAQILLHMNPSSVPPNVDAQTWAEIWKQAELVAELNGLQY